MLGDRFIPHSLNCTAHETMVGYAVIGRYLRKESPMKYEVRYQIGGEEHTTEVEVDNAATAAQVVQEQFLESNEVFELIQVHLLDDVSSLDIPVESTQ